MEPSMSKAESYHERRKLFKDIWDTSLALDEKETADTKIKPKVIKTVRLTDDKKVLPKRKKQRLKNLRIVCNKLLDYCDQQDAEDLLNEQLSEKALRRHIPKFKIKKGKSKNRDHVPKPKRMSVHNCTVIAINPRSSIHNSAKMNANKSRKDSIDNNYLKKYRDADISNKGSLKSYVTFNRRIEPKKILQMTKINIT